MSIFNDDTVIGRSNWSLDFIEASYGRESELHKWKFVGRSMEPPPETFSGQIEGKEIFFKVHSVEPQSIDHLIMTYRFEAEEIK